MKDAKRELKEKAKMNKCSDNSRMQIKIEKDIEIKTEPDSDESEEEKEDGYTRLNKFYNEANFENFFEENNFFEEDTPKNKDGFENIIVVTDELHKEYVSQLKSENKNVILLMCKNLCFNQLDLSGQACENSLLLVISGLHSVATVNNLPDLISPYIPNIKKLSWNMKKLPEFEEEYRQSLKFLKDLVPESCAVVMVPPLPAALMVNALNTTKSKKFAEFYYQFIKIISQLTIEMLEEHNISCNSIKEYHDIEDPVYEIQLSSGQNQFVLNVKEWNNLSKWYDIIKDIAGLDMKSDCPFVGYKKLETGKGDTNLNNTLSAASFIRQTNLVPSDNIPEIEKLEECMGPTLAKWPAILPIPPLPTKTEEYELKIFKNEAYKQQLVKLKEESNVSRTIVVIGEKLAVEKFCKLDLPTVKIHKFYVEENDYEATMKNIPSNILRARNAIWILFCDIASSIRKKKQSFCERHFQEKKCITELYMNSLNCSTEKDRCKKLNEFLKKLFRSLGVNSIVIPSPIIPQTSLLPASDTFKMEDFHNLVHESEYLRHLWIFLPSMQKLQITQAIKTFEKEWWKNVEKIMLMQNLNLEFLLDYKENRSHAVEVLENPRLLKENNEAYEEWEMFMKAIITFYMHVIENTDRVPIHFENEASKGLLELGKDSSNRTKSKFKKQHQGFVSQLLPTPKTQKSLQQLTIEDLATYKRKIYLNDIPKSLSNTALKKILNICGYVTNFHREVVGGTRAALCRVAFHEIESVYRAYHLLNERRVLSNKLCVVIPDEKHFTDTEKAFDHKYEEEDLIDIKSVIADVSSWSSKSPEHQKTERDEPPRFELKSREMTTQVLGMNYTPTGRLPPEEELYKEKSQTRRSSISPEETFYKSPTRNLKRQHSRSRSREPRKIHENNRFEEKRSHSHRRSKSRDNIRSQKRLKSRDQRSHDRSRSRDRRWSLSRSQSRSRDRRRSLNRSQSRSKDRRSSSRSQSRSRDRMKSLSRSRSRSQEKNILKEREISYEYKKSHERRSSSNQIICSEFSVGSECLALITLSENLGVLSVSFKMLMESCLQTQSIDVLFEEDNMSLLDAIYKKFGILKNSTSDIIKAEKFKCGAKICKKLIDAVISKKLSKQIVLPPTIPLQLPKPSVSSSSTVYESKLQKIADSMQKKSVSSLFPSTSNTTEDKQILHGVDFGRIAKCTSGKDAAHIKNFIKNSLEYVGVSPTIDTIYEIFSEVSMMHFKWAMNENNS